MRRSPHRVHRGLFVYIFFSSMICFYLKLLGERKSIQQCMEDNVQETDDHDQFINIAVKFQLNNNE